MLIVNRVMNKLNKDKVNPEVVSPNFVANFAYKMDIELTAEEVIFISDSYE